MRKELKRAFKKFSIFFACNIFVLLFVKKIPVEVMTPMIKLVSPNENFKIYRNL